MAKTDFESQVKFYTELIENGIYHLEEDELEEILEELQAGKELTSGEWLDLSCAFFEKIYKEFPEDIFREAVQIRRSKKLTKTNKDNAKAMIRLYKENR